MAFCADARVLRLVSTLSLVSDSPESDAESDSDSDSECSSTALVTAKAALAELAAARVDRPGVEACGVEEVVDDLGAGLVGGGTDGVDGAFLLPGAALIGVLMN